MIERIVITEDKCTNDARTTIRDKVWPEFSEMENGVKIMQSSSKQKR